MLDKTLVKFRRIKQFSVMKIYILLLNGTIESFRMSVHLGGLGIGVPMNLMKSSHFYVKVLHEFRAVIRENELKRKRKEIGHEIKELFSRGTRMACRCPGKRPSRIHI